MFKGKEIVRVIAADLLYGCSTRVQNRDLFIRTYGKLSANYNKLSILTKFGMTSDDTSQLETCHYFNTKTNIVTNALFPKQNSHFITRSSHNFIRCRSRILHLLCKYVGFDVNDSYSRKDNSIPDLRLPSKQYDVDSTSNQRRNDVEKRVETQIESTLDFRRRYNVELRGDQIFC